MGLPLFITPVEPDTVTKSPERMAAISRSTIRRRPVTRPRNTVNYVRRRLPGSLEYDGEDVSQSWGEPTRQSADREYIDTASLRSAGLPRGLENERSGDVENMASSRSARESTLQELSSRSASRENRTRAIYRAERSAREQSRSRLGRRHAAPTPPYHDNESDIYEHSILPPPRRISVMTPTLSPAPISGSASPRRRTATVNDEETFLARLETERRPSLSERFSILHRTNDDWRRSRNQSRHARLTRQLTFDGLGDRTRSLSPDGGWETILTSIAPDPQLPSAGSSFASTSAAAASASLPNSASLSSTSSATSMTSIPTPGGPHISALLDCDMSDDSNSNEEDEEDIYELHDFHTRSRRGSRDQRTRTSNHTLAATFSLSSGMFDSEHVEGMHHIITGLAERAEIPDEYWASAGLSRIIPRERLI